MELLLLRASLTAALVASTGIVQARCGPRATGWLVGLPLTSLPFLLLVGLDEGPWFARATAGGIIVGQTTAVACCAAYAYVARRRGWLPSTAAGGVVAVLAGGLLVAWHAPLWAAVSVLAALLACALACWPRRPGSRSQGDGGARRWKRDVMLRTAIATACVVAATKASEDFGPEIAGALVAFPTVPLIHAAFTQRSTGSLASVQLIENMLTGMWCGGTFVLLVAATAGPMGILSACGVAVLGATLARLGARPLTTALIRLRVAARVRGRLRAWVSA